MNRNWEFHSEIQDPKNCQKSLKVVKASVDENATKLVRKAYATFWLTLLKKMWFFKFWIPETGYFPDEILKNSSLWLSCTGEMPITWFVHPLLQYLSLSLGTGTYLQVSHVALYTKWHFNKVKWQNAVHAMRTITNAYIMHSCSRNMLWIQCRIGDLLMAAAAQLLSEY